MWNNNSHWTNLETYLSYLNDMEIDREAKIRFIENLTKLANINFSNFITTNNNGFMYNNKN